MISNFTPNTDILIQYLDGTLTTEDTKKLIDRLKQDEDLKKELDQLSIAVQAVKKYGLKEKISGIHAEMMSKRDSAPKTKVRTLYFDFRNILKIAASLLLILVGYGVFTYLQVSPENLISPDVQAYSFRTTRNAEASEIKDMYEKKEYKNVLDLIEQKTSNHSEDNFIKANSYFALHDYSASAEYFENILKQRSTAKFLDESEYYLALCYIKLNKPAEALHLLSLIKADTNHKYHQKVNTTFMWKVKLLKFKTVSTVK